MEDAQDQIVTTFLQKGNCLHCFYYMDCPRMRGGEICYSSPLKESWPLPGPEAAVEEKNNLPRN